MNARLSVVPRQQQVRRKERQEGERDREARQRQQLESEKERERERESGVQGQSKRRRRQQPLSSERQFDCVCAFLSLTSHAVQLSPTLFCVRRRPSSVIPLSPALLSRLLPALASFATMTLPLLPILLLLGLTILSPVHGTSATASLAPCCTTRAHAISLSPS